MLLRVAPYVVVAALLSRAALVQAALPIELEVAAQGDAPLGAMQDWNSVLIGMDLARVRLRGATAGDKPQVEADELGGATHYRLLGILNRRDELVLPGGKFTRGQRAKLKQFLQELPARQAEAAVERTHFGLTTEQFATVLAALSRPVSISTQDGSPHEMLATLTRDVPLPVAGEVIVKAQLRGGPVYRSQLKGLTTGTALAAVLRSSDLQFAPDTLGAEPLTLRVSRVDALKQSWPVGWALEGSPRALAPTMYRITNIEIDNYTLDMALAALAPHLGVPIVIDQRVLVIRGIDPAKVKVRLPRSKTFVRRAIDSVLSQGRLAGELRVDEAGTPFYWVTQFTRDSPRATRLIPTDQRQPTAPTPAQPRP